MYVFLTVVKIDLLLIFSELVIKFSLENKVIFRLYLPESYTLHKLESSQYPAKKKI